MSTPLAGVVVQYNLTAAYQSNNYQLFDILFIISNDDLLYQTIDNS